MWTPPFSGVGHLVGFSRPVPTLGLCRRILAPLWPSRCEAAYSRLLEFQPLLWLPESTSGHRSFSRDPARLGQWDVPSGEWFEWTIERSAGYPRSQ